ncbi:hypothetical protein AB0N93_14300 [Streptomyces sp. NPDC091267]|uniref:hypothetical protein n=1 Tax=Streptomyces sp. NPDC091267 TaxID=3155195 RepID=UPI003422A575
MGIYARKTVMTSSAAALLLCIGAAGTAAADTEPTSPAVQIAETADEPTPEPEAPDPVDNNDGPADDAVETPITEAPHNDPSRCDGPAIKPYYGITGKSSYFVPSLWNGTEYKDGPGGSMTVSVTKTGTITGTVTGSGEFSAGAIIAKAKTTVSVSIAASFAIAVGHTYTHDIGKKKYGHLQYGSWGYKLSWAKYASSADRCHIVKVSTGTAKLPTKSMGWKYWETSS